MNAVARYALIALLVAVVGCVTLYPFLDEVGRTGVVMAAWIAVPVQVLAFGLLAAAGSEPGRFFVWWGAGMLFRVLAVGVVGLLSTGTDPSGRAAMILSLVGFLFVLVLLEPAFLRGQRKQMAEHG